MVIRLSSGGLDVDWVFLSACLKFPPSPLLQNAESVGVAASRTYGDQSEGTMRWRKGV